MVECLARLSLRLLRLSRTYPASLFKLLNIQSFDLLHEVSGVKVPRPASPFITYETALDAGTAAAVSRGKNIDELVYILSRFVVV